MNNKVVNKQISIKQIIKVADYLKNIKQGMMRNLKLRRRKTKIYHIARKIMNTNFGI